MTSRRKPNYEMYNYLNEISMFHSLDYLVNLINEKFEENYDKNSLRKYLVRNRIPYKKNENMIRNVCERVPIGTEYIRKDGMVLIKISSNKWMFKQRFIYEQYYNVHLKSDDYIIFLDQNRNNFDINNLKLISRKESAYLSNQKIFSKNKEATELGIKIAKLHYKIKEVENNAKN